MQMAQTLLALKHLVSSKHEMLTTEASQTAVLLGAFRESCILAKPQFHRASAPQQALVASAG